MIETRVGNASDVGLERSINEDYFGATLTLRCGQVILVCDGMGGHEGGEQASRLVADEILVNIRNGDPGMDPVILLRDAFARANGRIGEQTSVHPDLKGMGSTAVVLLLKDRFAWVAHIGDSRLYRIQNRKIERLTKDHSLVQQMVDEGMIIESEAREHPRRNTITRALGAGNKNTTPDVSGPLQVKRGDRFVLCTDGLSMYFTDDDIRRIVSRCPPQAACQALIREAKALGGEDNITVQVVDVTRVRGGRAFARWRVPAAISAALVGILTLLLLWTSGKKPVLGPAVAPGSNSSGSKTVGAGSSGSSSHRASPGDSIPSHVSPPIATSTTEKSRTSGHQNPAQESIDGTKRKNISPPVAKKKTRPSAVHRARGKHKGAKPKAPRHVRNKKSVSGRNSKPLVKPAPKSGSQSSAPD